jgi:L-seryl-tRNA(Ser) seleniumtransferase
MCAQVIEAELYNEAAMDALKQIPPVNEILKSPELAEFSGILGLPFGKDVLNAVLSDTRRELAESSNGASRASLTTKIAAEVARRIREMLRPTLRRVINASGVVLHTNLGRAPLPEKAIDHLRDVAVGFSNLEFDIEQGKRGKRDVHTESILRELLGCEAAVVVNNNAAAVFLVLNAIGEGGEVIVSRGELVEIGESFRIPDIMARSGARLREVGSTNRTRIKDYEQGIGESTGLLLRVHPSNFRIIGFTERPSLKDFVDLGRRRNIPTFEDLGSGYLNRVQSSAFSDEPPVVESIEAGIDIVSFSADKLLGGPQAGIIAGKKLYVEKIRQNPLFRALRVDKLTIAVLEYVLRAHLAGDEDSIPIWKMLRSSESTLKTRAESFARRAGPAVKPIPLKSLPGGGSAPEAYLASWGVTLEFAGKSVAEIERLLRQSNPPVIARIEEDRLVMDFRTIFEAEEEALLRIVGEIEARSA